MKRLDEERSRNGGRVPYGFLQSMVAKSMNTSPWLTRYVINRAYRSLCNNGQLEEQWLIEARFNFSLSHCTSKEDHTKHREKLERG